jgi:dihydrofolate reductase
MDQKRKVILYIAESLDGYIAKEDNDISWLSIVERPNEDYGYKDFISTIDTVIMGRKTYEKVLSSSLRSSDLAQRYIKYIHEQAHKPHEKNQCGYGPFVV